MYLSWDACFAQHAWTGTQATQTHWFDRNIYIHIYRSYSDILWNLAQTLQNQSLWTPLAIARSKSQVPWQYESDQAFPHNDTNVLWSHGHVAHLKTLAWNKHDSSKNISIPWFNSHFGLQTTKQPFLLDHFPTPIVPLSWPANKRLAMSKANKADKKNLFHKSVAVDFGVRNCLRLLI